MQDVVHSAGADIRGRCGLRRVDPGQVDGAKAHTGNFWGRDICVFYWFKPHEGLGQIPHLSRNQQALIPPGSLIIDFAVPHVSEEGRVN